jgi:hypothetical protein
VIHGVDHAPGPNSKPVGVLARQLLDIGHGAGIVGEAAKFGDCRGLFGRGQTLDGLGGAAMEGQLIGHAVSRSTRGSWRHDHPGGRAGSVALAKAAFKRVERNPIEGSGLQVLAGARR